MPRMDKSGPEGKGPASGRNLGFCCGSKEHSGTLGVGLGRRFHAFDQRIQGKGKRLRYFQDKEL